MNNSRKYEEIEYYYHEVEFDDKERIIYHPLEILYDYYTDTKKRTRNLQDLTFAGDGLDQSNLLNDVKMYNIKIFGEPNNIRHREEWADPIRADILKSLSSKERSWYLSFVGYSPFNLEYRDKINVSIDVLDFFASKERNQAVFVDSVEPYLSKETPMKRLFIEVTYAEIEYAIKMIWPLAWDSNTIQGYNFPASRIDLLKEWENSKKDDHLFRRLLDETEVLFYTYPAEHRHFIFISNKYSYSEFEEKIKLQELRKKAEKLLKAEGFRE